MIDMPPECPPGFTVNDVLSIYVRDMSRDGNASFRCFLQVPESYNGKVPAGSPYFDFEAARKENIQQAQSQESSVSSAEMSPGEFYLALLFGGITFLAFAVGFLAGFIPSG
ncbi:hypothetical protein QFV86_002288 [Salmonella enterica]|nr:hypothetical protein [Salmonella enterica]ECI9605055.1 hypothetical protein [Salmonella enterica]EGL4564791.1 hypothetical protein [Salmonella enterica]EGL4582796.1 hypothetical protein [Salmonella enterica]EGL4632021.1 hypothetical protein [Salmonella enterica]